MKARNYVRRTDEIWCHCLHPQMVTVDEGGEWA